MAVGGGRAVRRRDLEMVERELVAVGRREPLAAEGNELPSAREVSPDGLEVATGEPPRGAKSGRADARRGARVGAIAVRRRLHVREATSFLPSAVAHGPPEIVLDLTPDG